jgi:hypothetical protein
MLTCILSDPADHSKSDQPKHRQLTAHKDGDPGHQRDGKNLVISCGQGEPSVIDELLVVAQKGW